MPTLAYCATLNNYTADQVATLRNGHDKISYMIVGHEVGEQNTPHLQIYFQLSNQVKFTTIKNWGDPWNQMHFESSQGSDDDNYRYCSKEGSYWEIGTRRSMGRKGARTDHEDVKALIKQGKTYQEIVDTNFEYAAKYSKFIKEQIMVQRMTAGKSSLLAEFEGVSWKPWQQDILDTIQQVPDRRKIQWIWESKGHIGKSWLAKYISLTEDALLLESGKKMDMAYIFAQKPTKIVLIDLSRTTAPVDGKDYLAGVYSICENLKNGVLMSTKYECMSIQFAVPHVIVFANWEPDYTKWSKDRYAVTNLN